MTLPRWLHALWPAARAARGHALLLHGPGDVGQWALARALSAAWLCEAPTADGHACGQCASCRFVAGGAHADLRLLVPDALRPALGLVTADDEAATDDKPSKTKPSKEIKIDAVRAAIDWAHSSSARGRGKVLVIHPAPALNLVAANALLKTLEEPPGLLRIVLTAMDPEALLPTVRSRCQLLALPWPSPAEGSAWLAEQGVPDAEVLLAAAGGLPGDALALHRDGIDAAAWQSLPRAARQGQGGAVEGWPLPRLVDGLQKLCADLMALRAGAAPRYFDRTVLAPLGQPAWPDAAALAQWWQSLAAASRHAEHPWQAALKAQALVLQASGVWQTTQALGTPSAPGRARAMHTATLPRS